MVRYRIGETEKSTPVYRNKFIDNSSMLSAGIYKMMGHSQARSATTSVTILMMVAKIR